MPNSEHLDNVKKIWKYFTCSHYTRLASKQLDEPLSLADKACFGFHHLICTFCRRSNRQLKLVQKGLLKMELELGEEGQEQQQNSEEGLSQEARLKIGRVLTEEKSK